MTNTLSKNILTGRPFGGVATLIHNSYSKCITSHMCAERYNIISIGRLLLVNVYLPDSHRGDKLELLNDILNEKLSILSKIDYDILVFGGDINCNRSILSKGSALVNYCMSSLPKCKSCSNCPYY